MALRIGDVVWLRSSTSASEDAFLSGTITNIQQGGGRLTISDQGGKEVVVNTASSDVFMANRAGGTSPDHCELLHLNEPTVLENTRARFVANDICECTEHPLRSPHAFADLRSPLALLRSAFSPFGPLSSPPTALLPRLHPPLSA